MATPPPDRATIDELLGRAQAAHARGQAREAERLWQAVLAAAPDHPAAHNALGMRALERRDFAEAERRFTAATQADPGAPALWVNLASALRQLGARDREETALLRALEADQRYLIATIRLAELHEQAGSPGAAAARWANVIALIEPLPTKTPGQLGVLDHARRYVEQHQRRFVDVIEAGLAEVRAGVSDRRRIDAAIDVLLGRRRVYLNQPHGLHFPFLPADEFFDRAHFPWLPAIEAQTEAIRAELADLLAAGAPGLEPYVTMAPGTPANIWTPLDGKLDWGAYFFWKFGTRIEAAAERCPRTAAAIDALPLAGMPGRAPTAFFSILKPRTRLPAHTGVTNARAILHLPLIVPPGCGFRVGGETRAWREGEAFAFDDTIEHEAWNDSDQLRAVLIFDAWNPHIRDDERRILRQFFTVADASGLDPGSAGRVAD